MMSQSVSPPASLSSSAVEMSTLIAICDAMGSTLELNEVLHILLDRTLSEICAQEGSILLFDQNQDRLAMLAQIGLPDFIAQKGYIPRKGSIAEWVIDNNQPLVLNDKPSQGEGYQALDNRRKIYSSMCIPLRAQGRVIGTINLNRTTDQYGEFDQVMVEKMLVLASMAAIFIENSRLHEANLKSERLAAVGQTVAGISHCVKNVLTGVRGGMSLIDMAASNNDWDLHQKAHEILHRNVERLASFVLDMLDYSKERKPAKHPTNANALAEEVFSTVAGEAAQRQIALENRLGSEPLVGFSADNQQIYRCVLNLVHNALDATPAGGSVWIDARPVEDADSLAKLGEPAAGAVLIEVGDTGPGIADEHRRDVFEPFFSTKGSKGTGLGLAVTRKIIQEHGGHIEVTTCAPQSAVFAIYLPVE